MPTNNTDRSNYTMTNLHGDQVGGGCMSLTLAQRAAQALANTTRQTIILTNTDDDETDDSDRYYPGARK